MLKFIYLALAMALTPFLMEFINTRKDSGNTAIWLKGIPAYLLNIIVCFVATVIVCALPGGWEMNFWSLVTVLFAVYFGNQAFFNLAIKPVVAYRDRH